MDRSHATWNEWSSTSYIHDINVIYKTNPWFYKTAQLEPEGSFESKIVEGSIRKNQSSKTFLTYKMDSYKTYC